jgi:hypothetical protein
MQAYGAMFLVVILVELGSWLRGEFFGFIFRGNGIGI